MQEHEYKTKDLGEASALHACGVKLIRLDSEQNFFWFVFENNGATEISDTYWSGELKVSAKDYNDSFRSLKERLFSRQTSRG